MLADSVVKVILLLLRHRGRVGPGVRLPISRHEKVLLTLVDLNFLFCKIGVHLDNVTGDTTLNNSSV